MEPTHAASVNLVIARKWQSNLDKSFRAYSFSDLLTPEIKEAQAQGCFHEWKGSTGSLFSPDDVDPLRKNPEMDKLLNVLDHIRVGEALQYKSPGFSSNSRYPNPNGMYQFYF